MGYNYYLFWQYEKPEEQWGYQAHVFGATKWIHDKVKLGEEYLIEPPCDKFLPDAMPLGPEMVPKTLVINLEDTLLHKTIEFGKGIELKKRPGLTYFLNSLKNYYEIVIFSDSPTMMAEEYVTALDPQRQT